MSSTEKNNDALRLAALLQCGADDPMWDQHCEMRKDTVADAAAELRRLHARVQALEFAFSEWSEKTDWVQETAKTNELGMHRADVLRARIEALHADNEVLKVQLAGANERAQMLFRQKEMWRERADSVAEAVAEEREQCAQILDAAAQRLVPEGKRTNQVDRHTACVLEGKSALIRARGNP